MYLRMKVLGFFFEWTTNFVVHNGRPFGFLFNLLIWRWGEIYWPNRADDFNLLELRGGASFGFVLRKDKETDTRRMANLCAMAAKLSYENPAVVKRVNYRDAELKRKNKSIA